MRKHTCIGCGLDHVIGFLLDDPSCGICGQCRDAFLAGLEQLGVEMTLANPIIFEMCSGSRRIAREDTTYYHHGHQLLFRVNN